MNKKISLARTLILEGEHEAALRILNDFLNHGPEGEEYHLALFMAANILKESGKNGLAFHLFRSLVTQHPNNADSWSQMALCVETSDIERAIKYADVALKLAPDSAAFLANKALVLLHDSQPKKAIDLCDKALKINPDHRAALHNKSLSQWMLRDWRCWKDYNKTDDVTSRVKRDFGLPEWNGETGKKVIVYGEQGVGDEIMFASCIEDMQRNNSIVFECDKRTESIFKRSLDCPVYGTRFEDRAPWVEVEKPDYQIAVGQLPYFFRKKDSDFPGTPYITPDPERLTQWSALLDDKKINVGITTEGGLLDTGKLYRSSNFDIYSDIISDKSLDIVCLDYTDVEPPEGVKYWPRAVKKFCDLEETVALIASLDAVITVCTTVVYIAGALGVPCYVLVPKKPGYRYHLSGESFPWYKSVKLMRGAFKQSVKRSIDAIKNLHRVRQARNSSIPRALSFNSKASKRAG